MLLQIDRFWNHREPAYRIILVERLVVHIWEIECDRQVTVHACIRPSFHQIKPLMLLHTSAGWSRLGSRSACVSNEFWWSYWRLCITIDRQVTRMHSTEFSSSQTFDTFERFCELIVLESRRASVSYEFWWSDWRFTYGNIKWLRRDSQQVIPFANRFSRSIYNNEEW